MPAALPVLLLASWSTVARLTSAALLSAGAKLDSADGALREEEHVEPNASSERAAREQSHGEATANDPGGSVDFRSTPASERRLPRVHQVQGIIGSLLNIF